MHSFHRRSTPPTQPWESDGIFSCSTVVIWFLQAFHLAVQSSTHTHSLTGTHTHTHSHTLTHWHTHTLTHSLTGTHALTLTHWHTHSLTGTHTHTLTHWHTHSHTHTHTLSLSLSLSLSHTHTHTCRTTDPTSHNNQAVRCKFGWFLFGMFCRALDLSLVRCAHLCWDPTVTMVAEN